MTKETKIVRQFETAYGDVFTQWDNGQVTMHRDEMEYERQIDYMHYVKETDFERYPQMIQFHTIIAKYYGLGYKQARATGLIPPIPKPVIKPKQYGKAESESE